MDRAGNRCERAYSGVMKGYMLTSDSTDLRGLGGVLLWSKASCRSPAPPRPGGWVRGWIAVVLLAGATGLPGEVLAGSGQITEAEAPHSLVQVGEPYRVSGWSDPPLGRVDVLEEPQALNYYDHGDPTPYEQLMMELVNRARADPGAEAARLGIDLNEDLAPGTITDTPKQPLAAHPRLTDAARAHSLWMLETNTFSHTGEGGTTVSQRVAVAGYPLGGSWSVAENIAWAGTGATVDPLAYTYRLQDNLFLSSGHRINLCEDSFEEVGIGIHAGIFTYEGFDYNALMATQNFAFSGGTPDPFLTGVAYYDFNGNGVYDINEAIGNVTVDVSGGTYYTQSALAGGYTIPVPDGEAERMVTFSGTGFTVQVPVSLPGGRNVKVDFTPEYQPPVVSGSATPAVGRVNTYGLSPVPGATGHEVAVEAWSAAPPDPADNLDRVIDGTSPGYIPLSYDLKYEGSAAYHLVHPEGLSSEKLTFRSPFEVGSGAEVRFRSRLRTASSAQVARVQVSTDDGVLWQTVYEQPGSGSPGEPVFHQRTVSLAAFAGERIRLRFTYDFAGGSYYSGTGDSLGWFIDAVEFTGLLEVQTLSVKELAPGEAFLFTPEEEGRRYWLTAQPLHFGRRWPAGPAVEVTAVAPYGYFSWALDIEVQSSLPEGTLADAPAGDFSDDGVANVLAYALGLDPTADVSHQLPALVREPEGLVFAYWFNTTATDVDLVPELSLDLSTWYPLGDPGMPIAVDDVFSHQDGDLEYRRLTFTPDPPSKLFIRLRAAY